MPIFVSLRVALEVIFLETVRSHAGLSAWHATQVRSGAVGLARKQMALRRAGTALDVSQTSHPGRYQMTN